MISFPRPVRYLALRGLLWFTLLLLARLAFTLHFGGELGAGAIGRSLALGVRFDLRLVAILTLAALPFVLFRRTSPLSESRAVRVLWRSIDGLLAIALATFVMTDFAYYAYLTERLNAGILGLATDGKEAFGMVVASYPIVRIVLGGLLFGVGVSWAFSRLAKFGDGVSGRPWATAGRVALFTLGCVVAIHGAFAQYPLRWSASTEIDPPKAGALSLNPVLNFTDTWSFAGKGPREGDDLPYRELLQRRLGADGRGATPYERVSAPGPEPLPRKLNVVLVILESCSGYRTSVFGNPLDPTPELAKIAKQGLLFDNHFTAHPGTARGVFTLISGVTDVQLGSTASRNPRAARHRFALADYGFAEKYYFIGGSTSWANVRGVLRGTVPRMIIREEGDFTAPSADVWGVSDADLLPEAAQYLASAKKPFFAVIQTASNHRPYTIPDRYLKEHPRREFSASQLKGAGFTESIEYDGMHYMDWSVGRLIEASKKCGWHDDTLFVFVGDHGITGRAGDNMPEYFSINAFTQGHTPLIFYSPKYVAPGVDHSPCIQADVLPTAAGFFEGKTVLRGLGRNLRDGRPVPPVAFMMNHFGAPDISVFDGKFYAVTAPAENSRVKLYEVAVSSTKDVAGEHPEKARELARLARAHYQGAAYMLTHNGGGTSEERRP